MSTAWYDDLRDQYRPERVRYLLIGESPPDPATGDRRFFYSPTLTGPDNLYRGVAEAAYGTEPNFDITDKPEVLERFRADGYWLVDLCDHPVNHLQSGQRRRELRQAVPDLITRARTISPAVGAIVCMTPVFRLLNEPLRTAGVRVLHDDPLPFPMNWQRARFIEGFRSAIAAS